MDIKSILKQNGMLISMICVFVAMTIITYMWTGSWTFISPENLSNLSQQVTQTGILAIGMTMVILIAGIDLSVGSILAVAAIVLAQTEIWFYDTGTLAPYFAIICALFAGTLLGVWNGVMIARFKLLPFVVTLAMLTIGRGIAYLVSGSQSIRVKGEIFKYIGVYSLDKSLYKLYYSIKGIPAEAAAILKDRGIEGTQCVATYVDNLFMPDKFANGMINPGKFCVGENFCPVFTIGLFILVFVCWLIFHLRSIKRSKDHGFKLEEKSETIFKAVMVGIGCFIVCSIFSFHQGIPVMVLIFALLAAGAAFLLNNTTFGRHLYAIGGNPEAARLSGINVTKCTFLVFTIMGFLCAIAGIVATSRAQAASPATQGILAELEAIAAVVVGGTSLSGGVGKIGGTIIGVLIIGMVVNAMILMSLPNPIQLIFKGLLIMIAIMVDMKTKAKK
ncbi:MAG: hypothetical protein JW983_09190 [Elusimicrobia bacterium]|nr:hypothetical protein [Elusimicrobiota bacterium]